MTTQPEAPFALAVADALDLAHRSNPLPGAPTCNLTFTVDGRSVNIIAEMGNTLPHVATRLPGTLFLLIPSATLHRLDVSPALGSEPTWTLLASGITLGEDILTWSRTEGVVRTGSATDSWTDTRPKPEPVNPPHPTRGKRRAVK